MTIIDEIKSFFTEVHIRLLIGFVFLFIGTCYPSYATICNLIAGYLGCTILVSGGKAVMAETK
jgi:hypothetical protein